MLLARFALGGTPNWGSVVGDRIFAIEGDLLGDFRVTDHAVPLADARLLQPVQPTQVLAVGVNYRAHLGTTEPPSIPQPWQMGINALIGPEEDIVFPPDATEVHYEGELVIVMKRAATRVSREEALNYVLGYTCGNDVSERAWQRADRHLWRAKGTDTFGPVGPWIATGIDPSDLALEVRLNGEVMERSHTSLMVHDVPTIISFISQYVTINAGDIIFTGATGHTSAMQPGDVVEVEFDKIGVLRNRIRRTE